MVLSPKSFNENSNEVKAKLLTNDFKKKGGFKRGQRPRLNRSHSLSRPPRRFGDEIDKTDKGSTVFSIVGENYEIVLKVKVPMEALKDIANPVDTEEQRPTRHVSTVLASNNNEDGIQSHTPTQISPSQTSNRENTKIDMEATAVAEIQRSPSNHTAPLNSNQHAPSVKVSSLPVAAPVPSQVSQFSYVPFYCCNPACYSQPYLPYPSYLYYPLCSCYAQGYPYSMYPLPQYYGSYLGNTHQGSSVVTAPVTMSPPPFSS